MSTMENEAWKSWVKWADEDLIAEAVSRVLRKYGIDGINSGMPADLSKVEYEDLRDLATFMAEIGYDHDLYNAIPYETQKIWKDLLNAEFDRRLGDAVEIYNLLDGTLNKEQWSGNIRFHLLSRSINKGYSEMGVLKNVVWYMQLVGKPVDVFIAQDLRCIMSHTLFWEFGNKADSSVDFQRSPEEFQICNECRKKEIKAQDEFVKAALEHRWKDAFEFIKEETNRK